MLARHMLARHMLARHMPGPARTGMCTHWNVPAHQVWCCSSEHFHVHGEQSSGGISLVEPTEGSAHLRTAATLPVEAASDTASPGVEGGLESILAGVAGDSHRPHPGHWAFHPRR